MRNKTIISLLFLIGIMMALCACSTQSFLGDNKGIDFNTLDKTGSINIEYAKQFSISEYGTYYLVSFANDTKLLIMPEDSQDIYNLPDNTTVIKKPLKNVYVAASSVMDMLLRIDALDMVKMTGTKENDWHIKELKEYIKNGDIVYAGKYNKPDYELILENDCDMAIENTMIYHSPDTKEKLEEIGIPVMVEQSSNEEHPLGRLEWIKLYGLLFDRPKEAELFFDEQAAIIDKYINNNKTDKKVAYFYINKNGIVNIKKSDDYIPKMIDMAGGIYVPLNEFGDEDNRLSNTNMQFEAFYDACRDADILIYNDVITRDVNSIEDLIKKNNLFNDFYAVKNKNVYTCGADFYQESTSISDLIRDLNIVINEDGLNIQSGLNSIKEVPYKELKFLKRLE